MSTVLNNLVNQPYKHGFVTDIETEAVPKGLSEDVIRHISKMKAEPDWLLDFRLAAYRHWLTMEEPAWANVSYPKIDFQEIIYFAQPKPKKQLASMEEVDPELRRTFEKLGVPLHEQKIMAGVAVDVIFDSVSVTTTYKAKLAEVGIIFCSFSEAVREHPELVKQYLGSVVPSGDNFYAALNSAVFTDGSFCFIPKGVKCPMDLSTYFRINTEGSGQFERTLIVAEEARYVAALNPIHGNPCAAGRKIVEHDDIARLNFLDRIEYLLHQLYLRIQRCQLVRRVIILERFVQRVEQSLAAQPVQHIHRHAVHMLVRDDRFSGSLLLRQVQRAYIDLEEPLGAYAAAIQLQNRITHLHRVGQMDICQVERARVPAQQYTTDRQQYSIHLSTFIKTKVGKVS